MVTIWPIFAFFYMDLQRFPEFRDYAEPDTRGI